MKPPTPAMIRALRRIASHGQINTCDMYSDIGIALRKRGWAEIFVDTWNRSCARYYWQLTVEGRRVLAEHTTTGDE